MNLQDLTTLSKRPINEVRIGAISGVNATIILTCMFFFLSRENPPVLPIPITVYLIAAIAVPTGFAGVVLAFLSARSNGWVWSQGALVPSGEHLAPEQIDTSGTYSTRVRQRYQIGVGLAHAPAVSGFIAGYIFGADGIGLGLIALAYATTITAAAFCFRICKTITALEMLEQLARTAQAR
jgi:hypothetical protein